MAGRGSIDTGIRLDIQQLQIEAQHRWLRPAEICEILRNYEKFQIYSEPPTRPPSGSLFLFDRKVLRYFRKDGHNWRKKKDGKTVKEAHEKLKVGSVDVLHCYYAHGEDDENFQRRSYWLLEEEFMHIVFVHYLEVKGNRTCIRDAEAALSNSQTSNSLSGSVSTSYNEALPGNTGSPSGASTLTSAYEEVESENFQAVSKDPLPLSYPDAEDGFDYSKISADLMSSRFLPTDEFQGHMSSTGLDYTAYTHTGVSVNDANQYRTLDLATWEELFEQYRRGGETVHSHTLITPVVPASGGLAEAHNRTFAQLLNGDIAINSESEDLQYKWQQNTQLEQPDMESHGDTSVEQNSNSFITVKKPLLESIKSEEGLQKVDSFSKWVSKELGEVEDLNSKSSSSLSWCNIGSGSSVDDPSMTPQLQLDNYSLSPSISQDQLFSIHDFSPNIAYTGKETKVLVTGKFLKSPEELSKYDWSCMFGEVEVPAEVLADGILCCIVPPHSLGRVPFYVTCSNRLACSEVREFEFRDITETPNYSVEEMHVLSRLESLLSSTSIKNADPLALNIGSKQPVVDKISELMEDDQYRRVVNPLKEQLFSWLLGKVCEDGKGPNILDEGGQGVLHLAAAIGYDWVIPPTLAAGVSVNFRDVNGWTALHWAAFYGRERTVALLLSLGAAPGALTDPSPGFPWGRPPADLASANGYKGISGFLAESSLTSHLASLTVNDQTLDGSFAKAVVTISERTATPGFEGAGSDALLLQDSLAALRNATQAADRIHQLFRMQSFQRKQISEHVGDELSLSDERLLSLISSKMKKPGQHELANSAATRIQKKFRGWKQRKEFLIIRQRVVKIQAHVRGHQVRKRYKAVVWSVGILEKVILRWRRKGTGLRGFRTEALNKAPSTQERPIEEDDYDYLREGRKQTEERLEKTLVRVKSMVQSDEGRAQYRRLLTAVEEFQKRQQNTPKKILGSSEDLPGDGEDEMIDVESLLGDDNFMAIAFE